MVLCGIAGSVRADGGSGAMGVVMASRAARANSTAVLYRSSGLLAIPLAMTVSNPPGR
jgi:hypothetical protein